MVLLAWRDGFGRVMRAPALVGGVFVVTLLVALPFALTLRGAIESHLGSSLMADSAADGVNYDWWQEFASQATGVATTFTPSVIGFASTLDTFGGLLDKRALISPLAWAVSLYLGVWVFLWGGILDRLARGRCVGARAFFAASGTFFFRFLRLGLAAVATYWFLFAYVYEWLFVKWYVNATRDVSVEPTVFFWRLLMYAIFGSLLVLVTTTFDYAKIRAVVEDRRSMVFALVAAMRFMIRNPGRVVGLYILNAIMFLAVVAVWANVAPGAGGMGISLWAGVVATQCYLAARLIAKLQFAASATVLFQRTLAHSRYVAAPSAASGEPPVIEAISRIS